MSALGWTLLIVAIVSLTIAVLGLVYRLGYSHGFEQGRGIG